MLATGVFVSVNITELGMRLEHDSFGQFATPTLIGRAVAIIGDMILFTGRCSVFGERPALPDA